MVDEHGELKPIVYMLDPYHPRAVARCRELFHLIGPNDPQNAEWKEKARYVLVGQCKITAKDIAEARRLRAIGKQGVGIDGIDQAACKANGVQIFNTPGINKGAVAELTLGLALAVAREFGPVTRKQTAGITVAKKMCSGQLLSGKKVGIIGMGNIGTAVARAFRGALGVSLIAYDPYVPTTTWNDIPHTRVENLDDLVRKADVVTLHCPLKEDTRDMISYREMCLMKPTTILINAARGGVVNEDDLLRALQEKVIWGAGIDVYTQEPPTPERYGKLWEQNVISTPLLGAATDKTQGDTAVAAVERLFGFVEQY
ncbi:hypothetical protein M409DRAFT_36080 [Zasmidium cellare ATCC 36951]|uniref:S-adenosyl-L-homocysteine hydrolase NAD binding domain-containing protein n=1 Tax=Zasmidium cellare ATCC 36951 TaxID=1080233 RepID=A0A6A6CRP4_ZASCE|nr:uncharacterized protein M409DRAFT_36080 [Zasmidium cellare ATCC 36951]KAF2169745.1 hypothetical protein M409DRAFT_36080 [Zasmidium cellare ATCC 36951]